MTGVKEDGKLDLSIREKAYLQIGTDAEKVMAAIESFDQSRTAPILPICATRSSATPCSVIRGIRVVAISRSLESR